MNRKPLQDSEIEITNHQGYDLIVIPHATGWISRIDTVSKSVGGVFFWCLLLLALTLISLFLMSVNWSEDNVLFPGILIVISIVLGCIVIGWTIRGVRTGLSFIFPKRNVTAIEKLLLNNPQLAYDPGDIPFSELSNYPGFRVSGRKKSFNIEFTPEEIPSLALRETDRGQQLTMKQGKKRIEMASRASKADRTWLFNYLKTAYSLPSNEALPSSRSVDWNSINVDTLRTPPSGAWVKVEKQELVLGATIRAPDAVVLLPIFFAWFGFVGLYGSQLVNNGLGLGSILTFLLLLLGLLILGAATLMTVCGKVEVRLQSHSGNVFQGVGFFGSNHRLDWAAVTNIYLEQREVFHSDSPSLETSIRVEGQECALNFGEGLNKDRREFLCNSLKSLKAKTG